MNLDRRVPVDDASRCLLAMRLLFQNLLRNDPNSVAKGTIFQSMNVVIESFTTRDYIGGEIVARVDIEMHDETAYASIWSTCCPRVRLKPAVVESRDGAWGLLVQILSSF